MALKYSRARRDCLCFIELAGIRTNDSCEFAFYIAPIRFQWFGSILQGCAVGTAFVSSEHVGIHCDITSRGGREVALYWCVCVTSATSDRSLQGGFRLAPRATVHTAVHGHR